MKKCLLLVYLLILSIPVFCTEMKVCTVLKLEGTKEQIEQAKHLNQNDKVKSLSAQYELNQAAFAKLQKEKFQELKDWYQQDNAHKKAVEYAFAKDYAQLTKGGTFCRIPEAYVKQFFNKYKNTPCKEIVQRLFLDRYTPIWTWAASYEMQIQRYIFANYLNSIFQLPEEPMPDYYLSNNDRFINDYRIFFTVIYKTYQAINRLDKVTQLKSLWLSQILESPFEYSEISLMERNDGILWKYLAGKPTPEQLQGTKRLVKWCKEPARGYMPACSTFIEHAKKYGYYQEDIIDRLKEFFF